MIETPPVEEGATPAIGTEAAPMECMGRFKHHYEWVWERTPGTQPVMTNMQMCSTCGDLRVPEVLRKLGS